MVTRFMINSSVQLVTASVQVTYESVNVSLVKGVQNWLPLMYSGLHWVQCKLQYDLVEIIRTHSLPY